MRNLLRNQQTIYYSNLTEDAVDEWGNACREYESPQPYKISVAPNTGETVYSGFGTALEYDRTMTTTDKNCPINEFTRLWIGISPTEPHNFEVKKKAENLNQIAFAVKQVEVSVNETN